MLSTKPPPFLSPDPATPPPPPPRLLVIVIVSVFVRVICIARVDFHFVEETTASQVCDFHCCASTIHTDYTRIRESSLDYDHSAPQWIFDNSTKLNQAQSVFVMAPVPKSTPSLPEPRLLTRALPVNADDEIVISGMSGKFPSCNNVQEFKDNLYQKVSVAVCLVRWQNITIRSLNNQ